MQCPAAAHYGSHCHKLSTATTIAAESDIDNSTLYREGEAKMDSLVSTLNDLANFDLTDLIYSPGFYDTIRRYFRVTVVDERDGEEIRYKNETTHRIETLKHPSLQFNNDKWPNLIAHMDYDLSPFPSPPVNPMIQDPKLLPEWLITTDFLLSHKPSAFEEWRHDHFLCSELDTAILNIEFRGADASLAQAEAHTIAVGTKILWNRIMFQRERSAPVPTPAEPKPNTHYSVLMTPYLWAIWEISHRDVPDEPEEFKVKPLRGFCPLIQISRESFWAYFDSYVALGSDTVSRQVNTT